MRSLKYSLFKIGLFSNKWVLYTIAISLLLMIGIIYLPWISGIFQFVPLSFKEFFAISLISSSVFVVGEIYKKVRSNEIKGTRGFFSGGSDPGGAAAVVAATPGR